MAASTPDSGDTGQVDADSMQPQGYVEQPQLSTVPLITNSSIDGITAVPVDPALLGVHNSMHALPNDNSSSIALLSNIRSKQAPPNDYSMRVLLSNDYDMQLLPGPHISTIDSTPHQTGNIPLGAGNHRVHVRRVDAPSSRAKAYMVSLNMQSGLHVVAAAKVAKAYKDHAEFGLFFHRLMISDNFLYPPHFCKGSRSLTARCT